MPRKTDTVNQEPITAALLKSRKDSDVGLPFSLGKADWATASTDSVSTAALLPYTSPVTPGKPTGDANVDAIADVVRRKVGNLDVFLRSQGEKLEDYTPQELHDLNGQLDDAIVDCARGFAKDGWSAHDDEKYADKAWRADLGTTFFQKMLSNAVAYVPMSGAMLAASFLLTPILGPLPTMVVGLGVGLYTAYKWSVHALNAAGKVDAKVNDEKEGRGRFWNICPSKGLWQALGKETLADVALRTGPRSLTKAAGGGIKIGLQTAGAAPGFTALFGGLILPAISAIIGPPTNAAMQVGSKMLHGRNGERSAAPLLGIKLEKKNDGDKKTKARIYADHEARTRNAGRLAKSGAHRFFSMAKKMAPEYRRSFGDAYRAEKQEGMKGKWRELIFGANVLPGGGLGDLVSLAGNPTGSEAGNAVNTFGNDATSALTGPGNVFTRKEVADRYTDGVKKRKANKASQKVSKRAPEATVDSPRSATATGTATASPAPSLSPDQLRISPDRPISRPDYRQSELPATPAMRRLRTIASGPASDAAPTQRYVPAGFPTVPLAPQHLVSRAKEQRIVEAQTVIPRPVGQAASDPTPNPSAVAATVASGPMENTGWRPRVAPQDGPPSNSALGAPPLGMPREVPGHWFELGSQASAPQPAAFMAEFGRALQPSIANGVEQPAAMPGAANKAEIANENGAPLAALAWAQGSTRENRNAPPTLRVPEAGARAENQSDLSVRVPTHNDESHAANTTSDTALNDALLKSRRCRSQLPARDGTSPSATTDTRVPPTPPTTPRGPNRIAIPVAAGHSVSLT